MKIFYGKDQAERRKAILEEVSEWGSIHCVIVSPNQISSQNLKAEFKKEYPWNKPPEFVSFSEFIKGQYDKANHPVIFVDNIEEGLKLCNPSGIFAGISVSNNGENMDCGLRLLDLE